MAVVIVDLHLGVAEDAAALAAGQVVAEQVIEAFFDLRALVDAGAVEGDQPGRGAREAGGGRRRADSENRPRRSAP